MWKKKDNFLHVLSKESVANDVVLPHHSRSIEARPSGSSAFHRAASDWTRSRPGPPVPRRTLSTRSRWDATGRHGNLRAQHKQLEPLSKSPVGSECNAGGRRDTKGCIRSSATHGILQPLSFVAYWNRMISECCFCMKCICFRFFPSFFCLQLCLNILPFHFNWIRSGLSWLSPQHVNICLCCSAPKGRWRSFRRLKILFFQTLQQETSKYVDSNRGCILRCFLFTWTKFFFNQSCC